MNGLCRIGIESIMVKQKTVANTGYNPLLAMAIDQKTVTLTWLDSYSENPTDFHRNGIIAKPLCVI